MRNLFLPLFLVALLSSCSDNELELDNTEYFTNEHFIQFDDYALYAHYADFLPDETLLIGGTGHVSGSFASDPFVLEINEDGEEKGIHFYPLQPISRYRGMDMVSTHDEKYVIATTEWQSTSNSDFHVMKVGRDGEKDWEFSLGDQELYEEAIDVDRTGDSDFIVFGREDEQDWNTDETYLLSRLSQDGHVLWQRSITDLKARTLGTMVCSERNDHFYILNHYNGEGFISGPLSIKKFNGQGEVVDSLLLSELGSTLDYSEGMKELEDGNFLVHYSAYEKGVQGDFDLVVKWIDSDLNVLRGFRDNDVPNNLVKDVLLLPDDGLLALSQSAHLGDGKFDIILTEYDDVGRVLWRSVFGGPASDHALALKRKANGDIWIVGNTNQGQSSSNSYELILIRVDAQGVPL